MIVYYCSVLLLFFCGGGGGGGGGASHSLGAKASSGEVVLSGRGDDTREVGGHIFQKKSNTISARNISRDILIREVITCSSWSQQYIYINIYLSNEYTVAYLLTLSTNMREVILC